jgi:IMP cyclohydrolase
MREDRRIDGLEALRRMSYPGRVVIIGKATSGDIPFVVYCITGRSPSSQARRIVFEETRAMVRPTEEDGLEKGDPELLLYPAIMISQGIAVSNGRQTSSIRPFISPGLGPVEVLAQAMEGWDYEPDAPNFTPRISGCVLSSSRAALSIAKHGGGGHCVKYYYEFPLQAGRARMISTYTGENVDPLPSFQGEPLELRLGGATAGKTAKAVYEAMAPAENSLEDFRVATVCVYLHSLQTDAFEKAVINRHERKNHD